MNLRKKILLAGAVLGATGVMLGAMGAHALKEVLSESSLESFNTGVRYQMYHAIFLIALGALNLEKMKYIYWFALTGTLFFSLSIYLLNLGPVYGMNMRFLGPVTPLGGLMLITAWILLAVNIVRNNIY